MKNAQNFGLKKFFRFISLKLKNRIGLNVSSRIGKENYYAARTK